MKQKCFHKLLDLMRGNYVVACTAFGHIYMQNVCCERIV